MTGPFNKQIMEWFANTAARVVVEWVCGKVTNTVNMKVSECERKCVFVRHMYDLNLFVTTVTTHVKLRLLRFKAYSCEHTNA